MKCFLFLSFIFLVSFAHSQNVMIRTEIEILDEETGLLLKDSHVDIYQNGLIFKSSKLLSDSTKIIMDFPIGFNYQMYFKCESYWTKMIEFELVNVNSTFKDSINVQGIQVSLFKKVDGFDFSFMETTPLVKFAISKNGPFLDFDREYTGAIAKKINQFKSMIPSSKKKSELNELPKINYEKRQNYLSEDPVKRPLEEPSI